jgi:hypothetical protein
MRDEPVVEQIAQVVLEGGTSRAWRAQSLARRRGRRHSAHVHAANRYLDNRRRSRVIFEQARLGEIRDCRRLSEGPRLDLPRRRNRNDCLSARAGRGRRFDHNALTFDDIALMLVDEHPLRCYGRRCFRGRLLGQRNGFTIRSWGLNDVPRLRIQSVF